MKIFIKDININYEVSGVGAPLIFLHGWGLDLHTFDNLAKELSEDYSVYQIDLPGFGESDISDSYNIEEYANYINEFCLSLAIINPIIVGHSFGGRVAMMYASRYDVDKLILISSPGIKEKLSVEFKESNPKEFEEAMIALRASLQPQPQVQSNEVMNF